MDYDIKVKADHLKVMKEILLNKDYTKNSEPVEYWIHGARTTLNGEVISNEKQILDKLEELGFIKIRGESQAPKS